MIDAPLVPIAGQTVHVLTAPGEVVYCACFGRYGTAGHYLDFACGCFRASRRVYEALPPPWFDFGYDETLTRKTQCECARFAQRLSTLSLPDTSPAVCSAAAEGGPCARPVVSRQVGVIGRLTDVVLVPNGRGRMRIVSPHELAVSAF
jgi:hypothetical protein